MIYKYLAVDRSGQSISGLLDASSEREASRALQRQGLTAVEVVCQSGSANRWRSNRQASNRELQLVLHEFATLLESGVPLVVALTSLSRSTHHPQVTGAFSELAKAVSRGEGFGRALRESKLTLPSYFHQLVEAGEATGKLAEALRGGVDQFEYQERVRSEIRSALVYPVILVVSGIAAIGIIFVWVVPRFSTLLAQKGAQMPWIAQAVISTGTWLNQNLLLVALFVIGLVGLVAWILRRPGVWARLGERAAKLPLLGEWLIDSEVGRWAGTLAAMLANRVELMRALELAADTMTLNFLRGRLQQVSKSVKAGANLSMALREHRALNATGYDLIAVGEATGELPKLLQALSKLYETSGRDRMKRVLQLIEPLAIIVIGSVIGVIVTSIILAITSVNDVPL